MILNSLKKIFFKKKNYNTKKIKDILNNIIKISNSNIFNQKFNIPNTFNSKYEIILILIFLLHIRFKNEIDKIKMQLLYNYFFEYIDFSLREIGTGDLSVGKKVKSLAKIFSFRMQQYKKITESYFVNIKKLIKKNIYNNNIKQKNLNNFYNYILKHHKKLNNSTSNEIFIKNFFHE